MELQNLAEEEMYFGNIVNYFYSHPMGKTLAFLIFKRIWWGYFYRQYKLSSYSLKTIDEDIQKYKINMDEYLIEDWKNYNHFFTRKFKPGKRSFNRDKETICAFAEGKYLVYDNTRGSIEIKGETVSTEELLGPRRSLSKEFSDSYLIVCRLCPIDYHRFHYPSEGRIVESFLVKGKYDSVNIFAQDFKKNILFKNKRHVNILETDHGKIGLVEIGGMSVATIVNNHQNGHSFTKGEEKGRFEYGGSSLILVLPKNKFEVDPTLVEYSKQNIECYFKLGSVIATAKPS